MSSGGVVYENRAGMHFHEGAKRGIGMAKKRASKTSRPSPRAEIANCSKWNNKTGTRTKEGLRQVVREEGSRKKGNSKFLRIRMPAAQGTDVRPVSSSPL